MKPKYDSLSDKRAAWRAAIESKGHVPVINDDGDLDIGVVDFGDHNGPGCSACGWDVCWHCHADINDIPVCTGTVEK